MSEKDFNQLDNLSNENFLNLVQIIYENNINNSIFPHLDLDKKERFITEIFNRSHTFDSNSINLCLKMLCLLIQEHNGIDVLIRTSVLESLQKFSGLQCDQIDVNPIDIQNIIEAEKCMSHLISLSPTVKKFYSISGVADAITQRIKETSETKLNDDIRFYDMHLLFLLTSFNPDLRQCIREKFHGLSYLIEIINQIILSKSEFISSLDSGVILSDSDIDYLIEILKTLYNLTVDLSNLTQSYEEEEEEEAHLMRLVSILRELILCSAQTNDKQIELRNHIINLLKNIPRTCYEELLSPIISDDDNENNGKNLDAINIILDFLDYQIKKTDNQSLISILQLLIFLCQSNRTIRKFSRQFILPPIHEQIYHLTTEQQTLKDKLIYLIMNSNTELRSLSAKFLFILCKENVNRLIKYTGFENLNELGIIDLQDSSTKDEYSSDSDEFENDLVV